MWNIDGMFQDKREAWAEHLMCGNYQWCRNETEFILFPFRCWLLRGVKRVWKETNSQILKLHSTATNVLNFDDYSHNSYDIWDWIFEGMVEVTQCQAFDERTTTIVNCLRSEAIFCWENLKFTELQGLKI